MTQIKEVLRVLEQVAPPVYQESYDNAGLITGDARWEVTGVLTCLDSTEAVLDEAIEKGCNLVVAHHPIVFKGLKTLTGKNYVERTIIKAIKNDIAIYAIHTNLDNVLAQGVNARIGQQLKLQNTQILAPKKVVKKLLTFVPDTFSEELRTALTQAGADSVGILSNFDYHAQEEDGFGADSLHGNVVRLEVRFPAGKQAAILAALRATHPFDQPPFELIDIDKQHSGVGSGLIGQLPAPMTETDFLQYLYEHMQLQAIKHTPLLNKPIKTVALCGGSGGFLLNAAIGQGADVFITADYKYHEFFDADGNIVIADIGHYESEQFTINLLEEILSQNFTKFAIYSTTVNTNPVTVITGK